MPQVEPLSIPLAEEQDKFLKEASNSVKKNAYYMKKAMVRAAVQGQARAPTTAVGFSHAPLLLQDEDNLREALRYSAGMLGELRTSYLSPQKYYELYMQVFNELSELEVRNPANPPTLHCSSSPVAWLYSRTAVTQAQHPASWPVPAAAIMAVFLALATMHNTLTSSTTHCLCTSCIHQPQTHYYCCCWRCRLQGFFADEKSKGRTYRELYELVQHAGNVLPRL